MHTMDSRQDFWDCTFQAIDQVGRGVDRETKQTRTPPETQVDSLYVD
jgi:hypothetical protein